MSTDDARNLVGASAALIGITAFAVGIRVWAKCFIVRILCLDDALLLFSWVMSLGICYSVILASRHGLGQHREVVGDEDYLLYLKLQTACSVTYSWGVVAAKASFAALYLRIFPERSLAILNRCLMVFLLCQALEETFVVLFRCKPTAKAWYPDIEGTCFGLFPLWWSTFVFNLTTDLALFIEPIPPMWRLQLPLAKRIGLIAMFSLGLLVTATSVIRIKYVTAIGADDTYGLADPLLWSEVEICALIICACIPALRQVAATVPGLNSLLGLSSSLRESQSSYPRIGGPKGISLQLRSNRERREYVRSQAAKNTRRNTFGMTSRAEAMDRISEQASTDEIFPHKTDGSGVIMVTHEVRRDVEANPDSPTHRNDPPKQRRDEVGEPSTRNSIDRPKPVSMRSTDRDSMSWLNN